MYYSDDVIEEVRMKNDIVDVISGYVRLQRKGSSYFGLCPFHNEKSPSFSVSPSKQMYYCFGCGAGGNVFNFIMEYENFTFIEAVKYLADRAGVKLPEQEYSKEARAAADLKTILLEINKKAAAYYYYQLRQETGKKALEYLQKRELSEETIKACGLGYTGNYSDGLYRYLKSKGYSDQILIEAGLFFFDERQGMKDKFWNRVMFPIMDVNNRVIGFGGRVMGDAQPKYMNSPETKIFDKSRNLYGLNIARRTRKNYLIICEGYMDVISMHQAGFTNAVASLGTALTSGHASLMRRYTKEVLLTYDSDEAGTKAALRAIDIINNVGGRARVIRLKNAKDPDEYINKNGVEKFKEAVKNAMPATEFKISLIKKQYDVTSTDGKILFIDEVVNIFTKLKDAVEVDAYITKVAEDTGISREAIASKYREKISKGSYKRIPTKNEYQKKVEQRKRETTKNQMVTSSLLEAEKRLLGLISQSKKLYKMSSAHIKAEEFSTDVYRRLAKSMYVSYENGMSPDPAMMLNDFSGDDLSEASEVFYNLEVYSGDEETVKELLYTIKLEKLNMRINAEADPTNLMDLFKQREELLNEKNTWEE